MSLTNELPARRGYVRVPARWKRVKMTADERNEAIRMYLAGEKVLLICHRFGRGRRTIMELMARSLPPEQRRPRGNKKS